MVFIKKFIFEIIFSILGFIGGYAYWFYIGCSTGQCPITSQWYTSALYGVLMGFVLGQIVRDKVQKSKQEK
ncbi:MAG: DUF6132 family protein [Bacteroidales bacterium]